MVCEPTPSSIRDSDFRNIRRQAYLSSTCTYTSISASAPGGRACPIHARDHRAPGAIEVLCCEALNYSVKRDWSIIPGRETVIQSPTIIQPNVNIRPICRRARSNPLSSLPAFGAGPCTFSSLQLFVPVCARRACERGRKDQTPPPKLPRSLRPLPAPHDRAALAT